jgi:hypothetical protein
MTTTTKTQPQLHIETGQQPNGTWWAKATMGQRPVNGTYRTVSVGTDRLSRGFQTQAGAAEAAVRTWFATAERVGWL